VRLETVGWTRMEIFISYLTTTRRYGKRRRREKEKEEFMKDGFNKVHTKSPDFNKCYFEGKYPIRLILINVEISLEVISYIYFGNESPETW
jgi:hypothetical protein